MRNVPNPNLARSNSGDLGQVAVEITVGDDNKARIERSHANPDLPRGENDDSDPQDAWIQRNKAVQKRLGRMQRKFDQALADQQAASQREIAELRNTLNGMKVNRETGTSATDAEHEAAQAKLQEQLEAAQEAGDSKETSRITRLIAQKENEHWHKKTMAQLHQGGEGEGRQPNAEETARAAATGARGAGDGKAPKAALDWIEANEDWWEDEDFMVERAAANAIHNKLKADGSDPTTPEHYQRVAKRLQKKFPELKIGKSQAESFDDDDDDDDDEQPTNGQRKGIRPGGEGRGPAQIFNDQGGGEGGGRQRVRGRLTLTAAQVANMRNVGMDPDNDAHVLAYAREANLLAASGEG